MAKPLVNIPCPPHCTNTSNTIAALAAPSAAVLAAVAALANLSAVDARALPSLDFLCPQLRGGASAIAASNTKYSRYVDCSHIASSSSNSAIEPPSLHQQHQQRKRRLSTEDLLRRADVPDRYELGQDGKWHKVELSTQSPTCPQCQYLPKPLAPGNPYHTPGDVAHNDVVDPASIGPSSTSFPGGPTPDIKSDLVLPPGWQKQATTDIYQVPIIVLSAVVLAGVIATLIVGAVVWRRKKKLLADGLQKRDLERRGRKKRDLASGGGEDDEGEGSDTGSEMGKRLRGQQLNAKVWAKATARWKANARWVYRRGRGKRPTVPVQPARTIIVPHMQQQQQNHRPSIVDDSLRISTTDLQNTSESEQVIVPPLSSSSPPTPIQPLRTSSPLPIPYTPTIIPTSPSPTPPTAQTHTPPPPSPTSETPGLPPAYRRRTTTTTRRSTTLSCDSDTICDDDVTPHLFSAAGDADADAVAGDRVGFDSKGDPGESLRVRRDEGRQGRGERGTRAVVVGHVATDDKRVLERMARMRSVAPLPTRHPVDDDEPPPISPSTSIGAGLGMYGVQVSAPEWRDEEYADFNVEERTMTTEGDSSLSHSHSTTTTNGGIGNLLLPPPPPHPPTSSLTSLPHSITSSISSYQHHPHTPYSFSFEEEILGFGVQGVVGPSAPPFEVEESLSRGLGGDQRGEVVPSAPPEFDFSDAEEEDGEERLGPSAPPLSHTDIIDEHEHEAEVRR